MSHNNGDDPKIAIECPACKQRFSAKMPNGEFFNNVYASGFVGAHERLTKCLCGQAFVLVLIQAQTVWGAQPVGDDVVEQVEGSRIVRPTLVVQ